MNQLRERVYCICISRDCCRHFPSRSTLPTSPNSHFRFHGCILHTQKMLCKDRGQRKQGEQREKDQGNYDVVLSIPSRTHAGNPSIFQCSGSKKHDACEAVENGGGVGKAGTLVSKERRGGGGGRGGIATASFAMAEERTG